MSTYTGTSYAEADAFLNSARAAKYREQRNIANNTRMYRNSDGSIGIVYHSTEIVRYNPDGTTELFTGGWHTITTWQRINRYSPERLWSDKGEWQVGIVGHTPLRDEKCRVCHGVPFDDSQTTQAILAFQSKVPYRCWRCGGTGRRMYGGKPIGVPFHEGIKLDPEGQVIE